MLDTVGAHHEAEAVRRREKADEAPPATKQQPQRHRANQEAAGVRGREKADEATPATDQQHQRCRTTAEAGSLET